MESSNENENENDDSEELPELEKIFNPSVSTRGMLSGSSPPKKRRRIDPPAALSKPFRSPFKTSLKNAANASQTTPVLGSSSPNDHTATPTLLPSTTPSAAPCRRRSPTRLQSTGPTSSPSFWTAATPRLAQLQKQHTALLNQLSSLRARLETTNQALEIEASTADTKLEALIQKWKTVSRDAAEEVYTISKERVDGAGGVKALKKQEREMRHDQEWGSEEKDVCGEGGIRAENGRRQLESQGLRGRREEADQDAEDDEGFTMEMMLKSLDIPLQMIGYDEIQQRWVD
ncbi:MAG: hypothetical protein Q9177_003539 [Variospora cf. flavescens]